jgi:anti-sigma factor RsiW
MSHLTPGQREAYVLDDLPPEASSAVEEHLRGCADCTAQLQADARLDNQLREVAVAPMALRPRRRSQWAVAAAIAAGLIFMIAALSRPAPTPATHAQATLPPTPELGLYEEGVSLPPHAVHDSFQGF